MEIGLGAMQMRPRDFWTQSRVEWLARVDGFLEMHGGKDSSTEPLTGAELDELIAADERGDIHNIDRVMH